jgi:hypothetical protein
MNEETEVTEVTKNPQPIGLRGNKRKSARNHIVEALAKLDRYAEPHFDLGLLPRIDLSDADWAATMRRVMLAIPAALGGAVIEAAPFVEVESPEIQIENHRAWQRQRSGYYQWSEFELRQLLEHLHAHPGRVLIPTVAHSVSIREPSGRVYTYQRDGKVT